MHIYILRDKLQRGFAFLPSSLLDPSPISSETSLSLDCIFSSLKFYLLTVRQPLVLLCTAVKLRLSTQIWSGRCTWRWPLRGSRSKFLQRIRTFSSKWPLRPSHLSSVLLFHVFQLQWFSFPSSIMIFPQAIPMYGIFSLPQLHYLWIHYNLIVNLQWFIQCLAPRKHH